ncbi:MAG: hypothetical protein LBD46_06615 [Endomicrobium sp.]|jgi:hypothetical protein|nr:hypothetical protein [Endomicrobium sp.]
MREELDNILLWINEATLTDDEWTKVQAFLDGKAPVTVKDKYQALFLVLKNRSGEGDATIKLKAYFVSKGFIEIDDPKMIFNNISIGVVLE